MGADLASPVYGAVITPGEWDGSPLLSRRALNKQGKGTDEVHKILRVVLSLGSWERGL